MTNAELVWDTDCLVAESPVWDAANRRVLFASLRDGRIFSYGVDNGEKAEWQLPTSIGSFGLCESGKLIIALSRRLVMLDLDSSKITDFTKEIDEPDGNRLNDGRPGPDGCYWVGSIDARKPPGREWPEEITDPNGCFYCITPDGEIEQKATGYRAFNGLAFTPDAKFAYSIRHVIGEPTNTAIEAWAFDAATSAISDNHNIIVLSNRDGAPDGAAFDVDGNYWSAGATAACVNQISPAGEIVSKIPMPCPAPTMPCFVDSDMYVTTLRRITPAVVDGSSGMPYNNGGLFRLPAPAQGAPVAKFADG